MRRSDSLSSGRVNREVNAMKKIRGNALVLLCLGLLTAMPMRFARAEAAADPAAEKYKTVLKLWAQGRQEETEKALKAAVRQFPQDAPLKLFHAVCLRGRSQLKKARPLFRTLAKRQADNLESWCAPLVLILDEQAGQPEPQRDQEAIETQLTRLQELTLNFPDHVVLRWLYALQLATFGKYPEAQQQYEEVIKRVQVGPLVLHQGYVQALGQQKKNREAMEHLTKLAESSQLPWAYCLLGTSLGQFKQAAGVEKAFAKAVELDDRREETWSLWGNTLLNLKRFPLAAAKYRKALEIDPKSSRALVGAGLALFHAKKYAEATPYLKKVVGKKVTVSVRMALAYSYFKTGKQEKSYKEYDRLVRTHKIKDPVLRFNLAALSAATHRHKKCIRELKAWIKQGGGKLSLLKIKEFNSIRQKKEFQKIFKKLEEKAEKK